MGAHPRQPTALSSAFVLGNVLFASVPVAAHSAPPESAQPLTHTAQGHTQRPPQATDFRLHHRSTEPVRALMLARDWDAAMSPEAFFVSEKLDGVRAHWDGHRLRSRSGRPIAAPAWFLAGLPPQAMDGELWMARGQFDKLSGIVRHQQPVDSDWRLVGYHIFDLPGLKAPFAQRAQEIERLVARNPVSWLHAVEQRRVAQPRELHMLLREKTLAGAEGLMLHHADAHWAPGRSDHLRKYKAQPDAEAMVVGYVEGKGQMYGLMGALELQDPDGRRFTVGTGFTREERRAPPPLGSWVSYRYRGTTPTGLPRFPSFLRVRSVE